MRSLPSLTPLIPFIRPHRSLVVYAAIALVLAAGGVLSIGAGLRYLVDAGIAAENVELLDRAFVIMLGCVLLLALGSFSRYYFVTTVGERVMADIRRAVYNKLLTRDVYFFETNRIGEILSRLTTDTTVLQTVLCSSLSMVVRNALMLVGGLIMLLITSAELTSYVLVVVPVVIVPIIVIGRKVRILSRDSQDKIAELSAHAEESLNAIRTVQAMTMEPAETMRFGSRVQQSLDTAMQRIRMRAVLTAIVISLVFGAVVFVLWMGGRAVLEGSISPGDLSAFIFYAAVVAGAVGTISDVIGEVQRAAGAAERISELLALQDTRVVAHPEPLQLHHSKASITFSDVSFAYPARPEASILQKVNFTVEAGKTVALIGVSGSGKSTLFQLILGFYAPEQGVICLGETDITRVALNDLRTHIALVPQDPVIFSTSILENVRIGKEDATEKEIAAALEASRAMEFITKLPQGMHTHVGEKGVQLSGGQRQRIAIARAMVRNAPILLLDEATSALDAENAALVREGFRQLKKDKTTLVIAHDMPTIEDADAVLLVENGEVKKLPNIQALEKNSDIYQYFVDQYRQVKKPA